jgi:hypothetical protein
MEGTKPGVEGATSTPDQDHRVRILLWFEPLSPPIGCPNNMPFMKEEWTIVGKHLDQIISGIEGMRGKLVEERFCNEVINARPASHHEAITMLC